MEPQCCSGSTREMESRSMQDIEYLSFKFIQIHY